MAGVSIGELFGRLTLSDEFSKGLDAAGKKAKDFAGDMLPLSAAIAGIGGAAIKMSTDFNKAMANVASLMPGSTARILELKEATEKTALATGKSSVDIATGLYQVVSAYGDTADTSKILEINARAAAAGVATTLDAINLTTAATKGYGDTTGATTQKVADLALLTVKLGQTTFPELAASIGSSIPLAAKLKVSQEELFASFAALAKVTGNVAEGSTQLKAVMSEMVHPSEGMAAAIQKLGFSGVDAMVAQKGLVGSLRALIATTDGSSEAIGQLFGGVRAAPAVFLLATQSAGGFDAKLKEMMNSAGTTDKAFAEQTDGINKTGFAMQQFETRVEQLGSKLGDALAPSLNRALTAMIPLFDQGTKLIEQFTKLPGSVQTVTVAFAAFVAILPALAFGIGATLVAVASLTANWTGMIIGITALGNTIPILTLRLALMNAQMAITAAMGPAMAGALTGIGVALAVVAAGFIGWKIGNAIADMKLFENGTESLHDKLGLLFAGMMGGEEAQKAYIADMDLGAWSTENAGKSAEEAAQRVGHLTDVLKGVPEAQRMEDLTVALAKLREQSAATPEALAKVAEEAHKLMLVGVKLSPTVQAVVTQVDALQNKSRDLVGDQKTQLHDLMGETAKMAAESKGAYASMIADQADAAQKRIDATKGVKELMAAAKDANAVAMQLATQQFISSQIGPSATQATIGVTDLAKAVKLAGGMSALSSSQVANLGEKLVTLQQQGAKIPASFDPAVARMRELAALDFGAMAARSAKTLAETIAIFDMLGKDIDGVAQDYDKLNKSIAAHGGVSKMSDQSLMSSVQSLEQLMVAAKTAGGDVEGLAKQYAAAMKEMKDRGLDVVTTMRQQDTVNSELINSENALDDAIQKLHPQYDNTIKRINQETAARVRSIQEILAEDDLKRKLGQTTGLLTEDQRKAYQQAIENYKAAGNAAIDYASKVRIAAQLTKVFSDETKLLNGVMSIVTALGGSADSGIGLFVTSLQGAVEQSQHFIDAWEKGDTFGMIEAGLQAVGAAISEFKKGTDSASASARAFGGAMAGMKLGASIGGVIAGPLGQAIGGAAGAIIGGIAGIFHKPEWARVGKEAGAILGYEMGKETASAIQKTMKDLNIKDVLTATLLNLDKVMADSGKGIREMGKEVTELFGLKFPAGTKAATSQLDQINKAWDEVRKTSTGAGDVMTAQMLKAAEASGHLTDSMKEFKAQQADTEIGGAKKIATGVGMMDPHLLSDGTDMGKNMATFFVKGWEAEMAKGDILAVIDDLGPSLDVMWAKFEAAGNQAALAVLAPMKELRDVLADDSDARGFIETMQGMADVFKGEVNQGFFDPDMQKALGDQIMATETALTESGLSAKAAMQAILPDLSMAIQAAQNMGVPLDANTQKLKDQAEAMGFAFPPDATTRLTMSIDALTVTLGGVPPKFDEIARSGETAASAVSTSFAGGFDTVAVTSTTVTNAMKESWTELGLTATQQGDEVGIAWGSAMGDYMLFMDDAMAKTQDDFGLLVDAAVGPAEEVSSAVGDIVGQLYAIRGGVLDANSAMTGLGNPNITLGGGDPNIKGPGSPDHTAAEGFFSSGMPHGPGPEGMTTIGVHPDEVVAIGPKVRSNTQSGGNSDMPVVNVYVGNEQLDAHITKGTKTGRIQVHPTSVRKF